MQHVQDVCWPGLNQDGDAVDDAHHEAQAPCNQVPAEAEVGAEVTGWDKGLLDHPTEHAISSRLAQEMRFTRHIVVGVTHKSQLPNRALSQLVHC